MREHSQGEQLLGDNEINGNQRDGGWGGALRVPTCQQVKQWRWKLWRCAATFPKPTANYPPTKLTRRLMFIMTKVQAAGAECHGPPAAGNFPHTHTILPSGPQIILYRQICKWARSTWLLIQHETTKPPSEGRRGFEGSLHPGRRYLADTFMSSY